MEVRDLRDYESNAYLRHIYVLQHLSGVIGTKSRHELARKGHVQPAGKDIRSHHQIHRAHSNAVQETSQQIQHGDAGFLGTAGYAGD